LSLLVEIDRLAWRGVVDAQGFAVVTRQSGPQTGCPAKRHATHRGKARAILGVARSFLDPAPHGSPHIRRPAAPAAGFPLQVASRESGRTTPAAVAVRGPCSGGFMAGIIRLILTTRTIRKRTISVGRQLPHNSLGKEIGLQMMWL
jgi:hypothetical protein